MMRPTWFAVWLIGALLFACASASTPHASAPPADSADDDDAGPEPSASDASAPVVVDAPERSRPASTASYAEALSTPEPLNVNDDRVHLTDLQLTNPVRGVLSGCRVPRSAKITIKIVVQFGRASGVTVLVRYDKPKNAKAPPKPPSKSAAKAQAKRTAALIACVDHAVRETIWPPSPRRDSFTQEF